MSLSTRFKLIKNTYGGYVNGYMGDKIKTGDEFELSGDLAMKATVNPDYEIVKSFKAKTAKAKAKASS